VDGTALKSTELASFDVLYFDDATGTLRTARITNPSQRSLQVTSLKRNTTYHFSITATDSSGKTSAASDTVDLDL
jgi:hypothetical protein